MNATASNRLTHADRAERRRLIADAVKNGLTLSAVARMFTVSLKTVREACHEFGVPASLNSTPVDSQTATTAESR